MLASTKESLMIEPPTNPQGTGRYRADKPGMVTALSIMTLLNGILNILWGLGVTVSIVLGTLGLGLLCAPITILPAILGVFEIVYAVKLLADPPKPVRPSSTIAILEIAAIVAGNVVSLVVGIVALVFYADVSVKGYFARINEGSTSATGAPVA
jgi:hypothetical protein